MRVIMIVAVLVRMDMPVLVVTVHLPSLTLPEHSLRTGDLRRLLSEGRSSFMIAYS